MSLSPAIIFRLNFGFVGILFCVVVGAGDATPPTQPPGTSCTVRDPSDRCAAEVQRESEKQQSLNQLGRYLARLQDLKLTQQQMRDIARLVATASEKKLQLADKMRLTAEQETRARRAVLETKDDLAKAIATGADQKPILQAIADATQLTQDQKKAIAEHNRIGVEVWGQIRELLDATQKAEFDKRFPGSREEETRKDTKPLATH